MFSKLLSFSGFSRVFLQVFEGFLGFSNVFKVSFLGILGFPCSGPFESRCLIRKPKGPTSDVVLDPFLLFRHQVLAVLSNLCCFVSSTMVFLGFS